MRFIGQIRQETTRIRPTGQVGAGLRGSLAGLDRYLVSLALCTLASVAFAESGAMTESDQPTAFDGANSVAPQQVLNSPLHPIPDYSDSSDHELTRLGARWDRLTAPERQALLKEVKLRMAQRKDPDGVLMIRTQRRYGRVYRDSNGRYLKIETKVIQVRPAGSGNTTQATTGFGVGFEKRNSSPEPVDRAARDTDQSSSSLDATMAPPVVRVKDPSS